MKKSLLTLLTLLLLSAVSAFAVETKTITITPKSSGFPSGNAFVSEEFTVTESNQTFNFFGYNPQTTAIRGNQSDNSKNFRVYNTSDFGAIKSVAITVTNGSFGAADKTHIALGSKTIESNAETTINGTISTDKKTLSFELTNNENSFFRIYLDKNATSGVAELASITITYSETSTTEPSTDPKISASAEGYTLVEGEAENNVVEKGTVVKFNVTNCEDSDILGTIGQEDLTFINGEATATINEDCKVEIVAGDDAAIATYNFTVFVPEEPKPNTWVEVTSIDQLSDGDIITFYAKEYTGTASKNTVTYPELIMDEYNKNIISGQEFKLEEGKLTVNPYNISLEKVDDDNWKLKVKDSEGNEKCMSTSSTKNQINLLPDFACSITFGEGGNAIIAHGDSVLRYNPNIKYPVDITTARFSFFKKNTQQNVYMLRYIKPELPTELYIHHYSTDQWLVEQMSGEAAEFTHQIWLEKGENYFFTTHNGETPEVEPASLEAEAPTHDFADHYVFGQDTNKLPGEALENLNYYTAAQQGVHNLSVKVAADGTHTHEVVGDVSTGIEDVTVDNAAVEYFNLQGVRVANPANGIYLRRQGNKVSKIYVR